MVRSFFRVLCSFFQSRCPQCGRRIGTSETCPSCADFLREARNYSM